MSSFPPSPSSQGTPSADSPLGLGISTQLASSDSNTKTSFANGESILTPTPTTGAANANGGVVRRKPARRANTAERRATHNAVERQRRETLNGRFLDLAALLPNLANVRRPSKSAIVNSSIALVHTQRRLRAIAARELRALAHEAESLRREVNEWRMAFPNQPVPSAAAASSPEGLEIIPEPSRSSEFMTLMEVEEISEDEMSMNEQERIAYEMRGGDSGPLGASFEDGEDDFGEDLSDGRQNSTSGNGNNRARTQSLSVMPPRSAAPPQFAGSTSIAQMQMQLSNQQAQAAASLLPSSYHSHQQQQQQQMMMHQHHQQRQQQQYAMQQQMAMNNFAQNGFLPPTFDAIAAAAQQQGSPQDSDAAKLAAWNAHLFSALTSQRDHFPGQHQQFHTPPSSGHGPAGPFGSSSSTTPNQFMGTPNPFDSHAFDGTSHSDGTGSVREETEAGANTPSSRSSTSVPPSLSLSVSGLSSQSSGSSSPSHHNTSHPGLSINVMGMGMPSSLPSALASPLHNLSLSQGGDFVMSPTHASSQGAFFGSAPVAGGNWGALGKSPVGTPVGQTPPPMMAGGGGGGGNGGHGYHQYPMMSMFV